MLSGERKNWIEQSWRRKWKSPCIHDNNQSHNANYKFLLFFHRFCRNKRISRFLMKMSLFLFLFLTFHCWCDCCVCVLVLVSRTDSDCGKWECLFLLIVMIVTCMHDCNYFIMICLEKKISNLGPNPKLNINSIWDGEKHSQKSNKEFVFTRAKLSFIKRDKMAKITAAAAAIEVVTHNLYHQCRIKMMCLLSGRCWFSRHTRLDTRKWRFFRSAYAYANNFLNLHIYGSPKQM